VIKRSDFVGFAAHPTESQKPKSLMVEYPHHTITWEIESPTKIGMDSETWLGDIDPARRSLRHLHPRTIGRAMASDESEEIIIISMCYG
jgi:hypothetical protein